MLFFPYFVCALLGVGSLRGGPAEGNRIFFAYCDHYVCIWTCVLRTFFLYKDPQTKGPGSQL